ncbi:MAG: diaminopropionate ammonia-lyase [Phyllobacteriaceae bacterium]|nr:diaminopropionate ammonia-lyase [Phyllobacteriaceae bacterium]
MFLANALPAHNATLHPADAEMLGPAGTDEVQRYLAWRGNGAGTRLVALPGLAEKLGVGMLHVKDEGGRLGLGSFKALGGGYAVARLVLEAAGGKLGKTLDYPDLKSAEVRALAKAMVFACATDGNHGKSVTEGAVAVGARAVIFVHAHVSDARVAAIARYGAEIVRVDGSYDESVKEAARVAEHEGWTIVSDTSWPGYERIPSLVMQGYTAMAREALAAMAEPPTHVFVQIGVGGVAAAVAAHMALALKDKRPIFIAVDPALAACMFASAKAGRAVAAPAGAPTVMAMLDCYEPSPIAWRVLERVADAFMTVEDADAIAAMNALAKPVDGDPAIVAGESGGVGLAGLMRAASDAKARAALTLDAASRVLVFVTEGATDPERYRLHTGLAADTLARSQVLAPPND